MKRQICVIDGRGGGLGGRLVAGLVLHLGSNCDIVGLGTNTAAAEAMKQAGATRVAIGAKAMISEVASASVILGPLNMVLSGAMLGEITPELAAAILTSGAKKVLLPVNRSRIEVVGSGDQTLDQLITHSLYRVRSLVAVAVSV